MGTPLSLRAQRAGEARCYRELNIKMMGAGLATFTPEQRAEYTRLDALAQSGQFEPQVSEGVLQEMRREGGGVSGRWSRI